MKPKILDIELYRCSVVFLVETTLEEWSYWYRKHKKQISESDNNAVIQEYDLSTPGFCINTDGNDYVLMVSDRNNIGLVAHEIFHAANMILSDRGYKYDGIDEPIAYLIEFLTSQFYKL